MASMPMTPKMSAMVNSEAHIDRSASRSERNSESMSRSDRDDRDDERADLVVSDGAREAAVEDRLAGDARGQRLQRALRRRDVHEEIVGERGDVGADERWRRGPSVGSFAAAEQQRHRALDGEPAMLLCEARDQEACMRARRRRAAARGEGGLERRRAVGRGDGEARKLGVRGLGELGRLGALQVFVDDGAAPARPLLVGEAGRGERARGAAQIGGRDVAAARRATATPGDRRRRRATADAARGASLWRAKRSSSTSAAAPSPRMRICKSTSWRSGVISWRMPGCPSRNEVDVGRLRARPRQDGAGRPCRRSPASAASAPTAPGSRRAASARNRTSAPSSRSVDGSSKSPVSQTCAKVAPPKRSIEEAIGQPRLGAFAEEGARLHAHLARAASARR